MVKNMDELYAKIHKLLVSVHLVPPDTRLLALKYPKVSKSAHKSVSEFMLLVKVNRYEASVFFSL